MRIALICTEKLPVPPVRGGAIQTYIDGVLPYLRARHHVTVIGRTDPSLPDREEGFVRVEAGDGAAGYCRRVCRFLAEDRWDAVLLYNRPAFVEDVADAAPGARLFLSLHNEMLLPHRLAPARARAALNRLGGVLCISDFIRRGVARLYPACADRLRTIRSGVDLERFRPGGHEACVALRERYGLGDRSVILSVGRLSAKKGIHLVLSAMERVRETHPEAVLLQVGSRWYGSDDEDEYVRSIKGQADGLGDAVRLAGYVPYDQVAGYFALGSLFVCASQWEEPLARVHYEAMASGLPVITTDRGGNAEVVTDGVNGLIVRPHDRVEGFAAAMQALLDDAFLRQRLGRAGRALVEREFGWERVGRELLEALEG